MKVCTDKGGGGGGGGRQFSLGLGQQITVYGRFDTKSFRYKLFQYKSKSFRYTCKVVSIHI